MVTDLSIENRTWLNLQETARYIGICEQTLSAWVRAGKAPPSVLISKRARRFNRAEVDAWVNAGGSNV